MGLSREQLVEKVYIAVFPGQTQQQKQLYRYEIESWIDEALSQMGREVAASDDYQLLQRTITLPIAITKDIPYSRFGSGDGGRQPAIDNGYITGDTSSFALSPERLELTGSPAKVRSTFLEWQYPTPDKSCVVGVISPFSTDIEILTQNHWNVLLRSDNPEPSNGSVRVLGTSSGTVFSVTEGDIFRYEWDATGALTITQMSPTRAVKTIYAVTGGEITNVVVPGVAIFGVDGAVSVGRMGSTVATTPPDGIYRLDIETQYQFLTSYIDQTGNLQFSNGKLLSWVPSLASKGMAVRCDQWYWTVNGESVLFWPGQEGEELPADSIILTGNIIPTAPDIPVEYHKRTIALLIEMATERALRLQTRRTQQVK